VFETEQVTEFVYGGSYISARLIAFAASGLTAIFPSRPISCDRAMTPLFTMSGPLMTLMAQALRLVSSWKLATSTVFHELSAPRNPSDQGPVASILTPIYPRGGFLKSSYLAHGSSALVRLDLGFTAPPDVTCSGSLAILPRRR